MIQDPLTISKPTETGIALFVLVIVFLTKYANELIGNISSPSIIIVEISPSSNIDIYISISPETSNKMS